MTILWTPAARASARRFLHDQDGMRAVAAAIARLADNPCPAEGFHRGDYHRLRVGSYLVVYVTRGDLITIDRVFLAAAGRPAAG